MWLEVGRRLEGLLRTRGATTWTAEDIAQEVLARVVARGVTFTDADDLMRWCTPVAKNLLIDHARAARWTDQGQAVPEQRDLVDVERTVLARLELARVLHHLGSLRAADRQAIVDGATGVSAPTERRAAVGEAVRRHRARQRLAKLVAGAGAACGWFLPARRASRPALLMTMPVAAVSALLVLPWVAPMPGQEMPAPAAVRAVQTTPLGTPAAHEVAAPPARPQAALLAPARAAAPTSNGRRAVERSPIVERRLSSGHGVGLGTSDRPADDVLVCVLDLPGLPDTCVDYPVTTGLPR